MSDNPDATNLEKLNQLSAQKREISRDAQLKGVEPALAGEYATIKVTGIQSSEDAQKVAQVEQQIGRLSQG